MNLAEARFKRKLTQWDLCTLSGVHQSKISLIENGYLAPKESEKGRLVQALGFKPEELEWPERRREGIAGDSADAVVSKTNAFGK
jgi:predicted transcriptional regulator